MSSSYTNQAKKGTSPGMGSMLLIGGGLLALLGIGYVAMKKGTPGSSMLPKAAGVAKPGGCGCGA